MSFELSESVRNAWDVLLTMAGMGGAFVAFRSSMRQWRVSQRWQRSQKLDELIGLFETDELLQLAATVLDYSERATEFQGEPFRFDSHDAVHALADHASAPSMRFTSCQAHIRDAYDRLLSFFLRLEVAISTDLIEATPSARFFRYWLQRFLTMDRHSQATPSSAPTPSIRAWRYVEAYGDLESIKRLCTHFTHGQSGDDPLAKSREAFEHRRPDRRRTQGTIHMTESDRDFMAGIVFGETSELLTANNPAEMAMARGWIAEIVCRRRDQNYLGFPAGLAKSQKPDTEAMGDPRVATQWSACQAAQADGVQSFAEKKDRDDDATVRHYFLWPSDDGKRPREPAAGDPPAPQWPFDYFGKVVRACGPFELQKPARMPAGNNIYVFIYDDIRNEPDSGEASEHVSDVS